MRVLLIAGLVLFGSAEQGFSQEKLYGDWVVFRSESLNLYLSYPKGWNIDAENPKIVLLSPAQEAWLEIGLPSALAPWFIIQAPKDGPCLEGKKEPPVFEFQEPRVNGGYREAYACRAGAEILLGYWEKDPNQDLRLHDFKLMLGGLRRIE